MKNHLRSDAARTAADAWCKRFKTTPNESTRPPTEPKSGSPSFETIRTVKMKTGLPTKEEVIIISSDEETVVRNPAITRKAGSIKPISRGAQVPKSSPFKLFSSPGYSNDDCFNKDCIELEDLVKHKSLRKSYQFSFQIDLSFFLPHVYPTTDVVFITGSPNGIVYPKNESPINKYTITNVIAKLNNRFGTHHTKMMINFFEHENAIKSLEVVVLTCNLTAIDFNGLTNMCWSSGKLPIDVEREAKGGSIGAKFKTDLINYLKKYGLPELQQLIEEVIRYDFSSVKAEFVASTPGVYDSAEEETYGYGKLNQILKKNRLYPANCENKYEIVSSVSSIAAPYKSNSKAKQVSTIFTHILCPLIAGDRFPLEPGKEPFQQSLQRKNYKPVIIFPTVQDVARSNIGYLAGQAIHYSYSKTAPTKLQYSLMKPYFHCWKSEEAKRNDTVSHAKLYVTSDDDWKTLKWALLTSANLSKQAWGTPLNGTKMEIASYEVGILIHSGCYRESNSGVVDSSLELVPVFGKDTLEQGRTNCVPIRFPFDIPARRYSTTDLPWSAHLKYNLPDRYGNTFTGFGY